MSLSTGNSLLFLFICFCCFFFKETTECAGESRVGCLYSAGAQVSAITMEINMKILWNTKNLIMRCLYISAHIHKGIKVSISLTIRPYPCLSQD